MRGVILFGGPGLGDLDGVRLIHRRQRATVEDAVTRGVVRAVVVDARDPHDFARAQELLRALYDNPRRPRRALHPGRVLAVIARGDVEAAYAFGRFGIAGVIEAHALDTLAPRLQRVLASTPEAEPLEQTALAAPLRTALLTARPADELPTVTVGYRHAPETVAGLAHYCRTLREHAERSTVFADVALLIEVMVAEGLSCQTNLATKAGVTHSGQFIGSFAFYRELRRTRYGKIPDHSAGVLDMDVFVAIDEVLHEVLHLLYLANRLRAGIVAKHPLVAEEISLSWWQAVIHNRVFPEWICDHHILEINDDFVLCEHKQDSWEFWHTGNVFDQYAHYPWVPYVIAQLPLRRSYIGQRGDLPELIASLRHKPEAAFLVPRAAELTLDLEFESYPEIPAELRLPAPS